MSFILDALRKSENSRLRQDHPAIFAARVSTNRPRRPRWVAVIGALLVVNVLVVGYALWQPQDPVVQRTPTPIETTPPAAASTTPATATAPVAMSAAVTAPAPLARQPLAPQSQTAASEPRVTRDDLLARGTTVPTAELNLHVYDLDPAARFVLLNGQRLREGELSREGLRLERITPQGVILNHGGTSFAVNLQ